MAITIHSILRKAPDVQISPELITVVGALSSAIVHLYRRQTSMFNSYRQEMVDRLAECESKHAAKDEEIALLSNKVEHLAGYNDALQDVYDLVKGLGHGNDSGYGI